MVARSVPMHKHTVGPLPAGLGNRAAIWPKELLITARRAAVRDHGGQTVLVVSHISPVKILLCRALGVPLGTLYRLYLGSACINEIQWHGRGFAVVHCLNDTSHLR